MAEKAKILLLSTAYLPHIGGSELAIKNITDRIDNFEFDLITARLDKKSSEQEKIGNVLIFRVGGFLSFSKIFLPKAFLPLAVFFRAVKLLKKHDYTVIHAFQASGAAGAGWLLRYFYPKLPFLVTLQEGNNLQEQGFLINFFRRLILKKADRATAISQHLKNYILGINKGLEVNVIPNGVNIDDFSRSFSYGELTDLENELGIKPGDKVIISVSRLVYKNGLDLLVDAFQILSSKFNPLTGGQNSKLLIVGDGPLKERLRLQVQSLKLDDGVIFAGAVNYEDLPLYLKISDVFVRPSRSEGLGSAFLEAMAAGVPVIGTKVGGIPDFLKDPSTHSTDSTSLRQAGSGRATGLFCSGELEDIAFKIRMILENGKLREEIVQNARTLVTEEYNWNIIADKFEKLYERLIETHRD